MHDIDAFHAVNHGLDPKTVKSDDGVRVIGLKSKAGVLSPLLTQQTGRPIANAGQLRAVLDGGKHGKPFHCGKTVSAQLFCEPTP